MKKCGSKMSKGMSKGKGYMAMKPAKAGMKKGKSRRK